MPKSLGILLLCLAVARVSGATLSLDVKPAPAAGQPRYMGAGAGGTALPDAAKSPSGSTIGFDNFGLLRDGKPWIPVMGEFHYSRYPKAEWRDELLKMKSGGITLVSTYVFWIHHEEEQDKFTWDGDKDLREFVRLCGDVGLPCIVRVGPWCHGEVRNGGFPDWVQSMPRKRSNDGTYLAAVKPYFEQIAGQLKGQLWKDGGPVAGIQIENEFKGAAAHLVTLKQMARDAGIDVPIYTRTAWDNASGPSTFGEILPLWGGYAEGFWDRSLDSMPGNYWQVFRFGLERAPAGSMGDPNNAAAIERGEVVAYPYLTCELGGGMMSSYHRRINVNPMDSYSLALVKLGSGSNLPGYYMYHGGTNPDAKLTDMLQETQSRGMWNDMPYKNYDFQAPLGAVGQVRESYHLLNRLHLFLHDYGETLARMSATFPATNITKANTTEVRWSVRSDGERAYMFVNNYQRGQEMPAKADVQFAIKLPHAGTVQIPDSHPVTIPANNAFIWPVNFDLGGATLRYATAQPLCHFTADGVSNTVFVQTPGVDAEFAFERDGVIIDAANGRQTHGEALDGVDQMKAGLTPAIRMHTRGGRKQAVYLIDDATANQIYKGAIKDQEYVLLSRGNVQFDKGVLRITSGIPANLSFSALGPAPTFQGSVQMPARNARAATFELVHAAGAAREIKMGSQKVAEAPATADFAGDLPAVYRVKVPEGLGDYKQSRMILRLAYRGDVARVYLGDKLLVDDYYNGDALELGLWRYPEAMKAGAEMTVKILPLKKGSPIYLAHWPDLGDKAEMAALDRVEVVQEQTVTLEAK